MEERLGKDKQVRKRYRKDTTRSKSLSKESKNQLIVGVNMVNHTREYETMKLTTFHGTRRDNYEQ